MSIFRAAARVRSPDGREWELYGYRLKLHDRDAGDPSARLISRTLARIRHAVTAIIRASRGDEWTIDAVTYLPHETVYSWTTTREHKGQVLAQVEGHLARGDVPQHLTHATYRGEQRR